LEFFASKCIEHCALPPPDNTNASTEKVNPYAEENGVGCRQSESSRWLPLVYIDAR